MPITTDLDRVRLLCGDTNSTDPILTDDEVSFFVSSRQIVDTTTGGTLVNLPAAAADCAGAIAAEYARHFDFAEDGQSFNRAQKFGHYVALEQRLRTRAGGYAAPMGGTTST